MEGEIACNGPSPPVAYITAIFSGNVPTAWRSGSCFPSWSHRLNIDSLVATYGYVIVAVLVAIEGMGVPVPGELALLTAGAFAGQGDISLVGVIIASSIGTIVGGSGGYWLGRTGGLSLIERYGHLIGINEAKLRDARAYFVSHGAKTILVARFIAILRITAGIMAGVVHMSFGLFTVCNAVGGIVWSVAFALLGDAFGSNLPLLKHYVHRVGLLTVVLVVVAVAAFLLWRRRRPPK